MSAVHRVTGVGFLVLALCLLWAACFTAAAGASLDYGSVSFVDKDHGWVTGIDDKTFQTTVWRTRDGGRSWNKVGSTPAVGAGVCWVAFVSRTTGMWGNGGLLRTSNAGQTWQDTSRPPALGIVNDASFATRRLGWAGCSNGTSESGGSIAATTDGGATWTSQLDLPLADGSGGFSRVSSPTVKRSYAFKWGREAGVWATADGGATWVRRVLPDIPGAYAGYNDIDFPAGQTGWAVGDSGRIVKTVNGGEDWNRQKSGVLAELTAVDFVSTSVGYAVGKGGCVLRTSDGGAHWVKQSSGTAKRLTAVCFVSALRGWMVGDKSVRLRTTDGGKNWTGTH